MMDEPNSRLRDLTARDWLLVKSLDFARYVGALASKTEEPAADIFTRRWPNSPHIAAVERHSRESMTIKATPAGSTLPSSWAYPLVPTTLGHGFAQFVQPLTLIGRLQRLVRRAPFATQVTRSTSAMTAYWAGPAKPKPLTKGTFDNISLAPMKAAGMIVVTDDLIRFEAPGSDAFLRDELAAGVAAFLDAELVDPTNAGAANESPASLTNGVSTTASSGDISQDLRTLLAAYVADGGSIASAVILLSSQNAAALALESATAFPNLTVDGGTIAGLPALASDAVGQQLIAVDGRGILLADDLGVDVKTSRQASVEMVDNPTNEGVTPTGATLVSLWQVNAVGILIERFLNWRRDGAIAIVDGADYLSEGGSPA